MHCKIAARSEWRAQEVYSREENGTCSISRALEIHAGRSEQEYQVDQKYSFSGSYKHRSSNCTNKPRHMFLLALRLLAKYLAKANCKSVKLSRHEGNKRRSY